MPKVSQSVKQNQTVKINIQNLLPKLRETRSSDYITPKRGMPIHNLNMGSHSRLLGPSIQYAIRPPEFLPLPERINSQGQPSYFTQGPARVGRPDLIYQETNPNDIAPGRPAFRALPSAPIASVAPFSPPEYIEPTPMYPVIDSPQTDESERLVAAQASSLRGALRGRPLLDPGAKGKPKERLQYGPFIPQRFQQGRQAASASAAITGTPPAPSSGFAVPRTPAAMAAVAALSPEKKEYEP